MTQLIFFMAVNAVFIALGVMAVISMKKAGRPAGFLPFFLIGLGAYGVVTTGMQIPEVRAFNAVVEKLPADMPSPHTTGVSLGLDKDKGGNFLPRSVLYMTTREGNLVMRWKVPVTMKGGNPVFGTPEVLTDKE